MELVKQSLGIDIAKSTFTACLCKRYSDHSEELSEVRTFDNNKTGFNQLIKWVNKISENGKAVYYVMEATGIYFERLAYHLHKIRKCISVVLPNKVHHYAKSLNVKTKTDEVDAKIISMMGCERNLFEWTPASPLFRRLRDLCRLHKALMHDKTQTINRLKQLKCGQDPLKEALKIYQANIKRLSKELKTLEKKMEDQLKSDPQVWSKVENILKIKGLGIKTVAIVLGETQGFKLIQNQRQLISYCGYDVIQRESGTSIKGKTRISKKGNSNIRSAMHFPSMVATRYNPKMKEIYQRIIQSKSSKKIGLVAIQRRLLVLMYSLWKTEIAYDENYERKKTSGFQTEDDSSSSSTGTVDLRQQGIKVDGAYKQPSTQNEPQYDQSSEALLRQLQIL